MKFIIIEISIIILGVICFFLSSSILDSFESNVIEIEFNNQSSYKLEEGKYYLYLDDIINFDNYLQSENQGVITTEFSMVVNFSEDLSVSNSGEIINLTPELNRALKNEIFGGYLYASFEVEDEANYDINIVTTNTSGGSGTYNPNFILTSINPKLPNYFEWIHNNIAVVTLIAVFIFGSIYVNISKK